MKYKGREVKMKNSYCDFSAVKALPIFHDPSCSSDVIFG